MSDLKKDLTEVLNCACAENASNTPDFILAEYLLMCLAAFDYATQKRDKWYGVHLAPADSYFAHTGSEHRVYEAIGCTHAYCCDSLDKGIDPRKIEIPVMLEKASKQLFSKKEGA